MIIEAQQKTYTHSWVVGDWSHDGHGLTHVFVLESNYDSDDICSAIIATCKKFGLPYKTNPWSAPHLLDCESFGDSSISVETLEKIDYDFGQLSNYIGEGEDYAYIDSDDWLSIHLWLVKLELPNFTCKHIYYPRLNIGGYGLFTE